MTILIPFHPSHYRHFNASYWFPVGRHWAGAFPQRLSYHRWVAVIPTGWVPLCVYLQPRKGSATGIAFIDATSLVGCHHRRIYRHRVFKKRARRSRTSVGWFYGFKLHRVVNDRGEWLAFQVTLGNVDDRQPVPRKAFGLTGKHFGDQGDSSQKRFDVLLEQDLPWITQLRKGMQNKLLPLVDKRLLPQCALIETLNDPLKNISQREHIRHRCVINRMVTLLAGLVASTHQPKKLSHNLAQNQLKVLNSVA